MYAHNSSPEDLSTPSATGQPPDAPNIKVAGNIQLSPEIKNILRSMFGDFSQVVVEAEFGRGFSGSRTFRVRLVETGGRARLPAAVKIAPRALIQQEWQAYKERVKDTLPYIARLESSPVFSSDGSWGGLHYALVGGGTFEVQSLNDYYYEADADDLCWVLENRLFQIMGSNWWFDNRTDRAFQMQADYDNWLPVNLVIRPISSTPEAGLHLLEPRTDFLRATISIGDRVRLEDFVVIKADPRRRELTLNIPQALEDQPQGSYRVRVIEAANASRYQFKDVIDPIEGVVEATRHDVLVGLANQAMWQAVDLTNERLTLSGELTLPNPLSLYQKLLKDILTVNISTIHGDLNLENVLVDPETREVSLIDFATVRRGHALSDLLRLETEVVIMLVPPILEEAGLPAETVYFFYEQLHAVTLNSGEIMSLKLPTPALEKPFKMLCCVRRMARNCLFNPDDWREYYRALILCLLGTLKFKTLHSQPIPSLPRQVAFWGAASAHHLLDEISRPRPRRRSKLTQKTSIAPGAELLFEIEPPFGTMRPDSKFYIEREADDLCRQHVSRPFATTLFVQAPMQMGKSSLLRRVLYQAREEGQQQTAFIDFQKFTKRCFEDEENFFKELCWMIGDALGVPDAIDQYWRGPRTNIIKCSRYLSGHIIPAVKRPFTLAMDEVERMLDCPFRTDFFGMLRTWHNNRVDDENYARMTLFLSSSTDPYLLIDNPYQSPFNVATPVPLEDFTLDEVRELNRRHNSPLDQTQLSELMELVNGHPFLTRVALYQLAVGKIDMSTFVARATDDGGPFGNHLRHYLRRVLLEPEFRDALQQVLHNHTCEENDIFHRLSAAGLIRREGKQAVFRYKLYERYFKERLNG